MNGEQQGQGGDGLFPPRQVVHGREAFPRGHAAVVDAPQEGLVWVVCTQNGLEHRAALEPHLHTLVGGTSPEDTSVELGLFLTL